VIFRFDGIQQKYEPLVKSFLPLSQSPAFNGVIRERLATWKKERGGKRYPEGEEKEGKGGDGEGETGKGLSSKWSAGNQILFISLRAALLFNDGVGITLWLAVDGKLFTVSLVAMERGGGGRKRGQRQRERARADGTESPTTRVQRTLGRAFACGAAPYATMYQEGEKKKEERERAIGVKARIIYCALE